MSWISGHLHAIVDAFATVRPEWLALALVLQLGNLVLRSTAWRNVLAAAFPTQRPSVRSIGRAYAIGVGLNGWLPARGGDAAKIALVRTEHPHTNAVAIATSCTVLVAFDAFVALALVGGVVASGAVPLDVAKASQALTSSVPILAATVLLLAGAVFVASRVVGPRLRSGLLHARQGVAIVTSPAQWARTVLSAQAAAWSCRIGVVFCMLSAFGIPASVQLAALVVVVGGMSTLVPVPGGAGTQQALVAFALAGIAPASQAIAFSVGMQLGVTAVNTTIALLAAMWAFGHLHPVRAVRAALASVRPPVVVATPEPLPDAAG